MWHHNVISKHVICVLLLWSCIWSKSMSNFCYKCAIFSIHNFSLWLWLLLKMKSKHGTVFFLSKTNLGMIRRLCVNDWSTWLIYMTETNCNSTESFWPILTLFWVKTRAVTEAQFTENFLLPSENSPGNIFGCSHNVHRKQTGVNPFHTRFWNLHRLCTGSTRFP